MQKDLDFKNILSGPGIFCIGGLPYVGKTTVGFRFKECWGNQAVLIDPDLARLEVLGKSASDTFGDDALIPEIHKRTVALMLKWTLLAIVEDKIALIPSALVKGEDRTKYRRLADDLDIPFHGFWLDAPEEILVGRYKMRQEKIASGDRDITTIANVSLAKIDPSNITGKITWPIIDAVPSPDEVFLAIAGYMQTYHLRRPMMSTTTPLLAAKF